MISSRADSRSVAFTLIELVAVVAIILVLAGLVLPVLSRAHRRTREVAARTEVKQIETAWNQYFAEYQTWPACFGVDSHACYPLADDVARILEGIGTNGNPKQISFMHFTRYNTASNPISPWGNRQAATPNDYYYCQFDTDYDGTIPITIQPGSSSRRSVIVWTVNPDTGCFIGSWQE